MPGRPESPTPHGLLRIQVLGAVRAWRSDHEVDLGRAGQRAVLALLALADGHPLPRASLVDALWGERPPASAANIIQTYVKNLRRLLEPERRRNGPSLILPAVGDGYALRVAADSVDLARFRWLTWAAGDAASAGDRRRAGQLLREALAIWRAPALVDVPLLADHPKIASLASERRAAVVHYADVLLGLGGASDALTVLEEEAAAHPLDEGILARLVRAHQLAGDRWQALSVYRVACRRLAAELGVGPGPELSAAYAALFDAPAPALPPSASGAAGADPPTPGLRASRALHAPAVTPAANSPRTPVRSRFAGWVPVRRLGRRSPAPLAAPPVPARTPPALAVPVPVGASPARPRTSSVCPDVVQPGRPACASRVGLNPGPAGAVPSNRRVNVTLTTLVTVMVCHDRPIVREGLDKLLDDEPGIEVVGTADTVTQAIVVARQQRPQVILTGLTLHGATGIDLISRVGREPLDPRPRFLVYASVESDDLLAELLRADVSAVIADDASREELLLAVRVAARGQTMLGPGVADQILSWFRERGRQAAAPPPDSAVGSLTPREREILLLTASGLSIEEIAHKLYIGVTTVRTHIYRVRTKLQVKDRAQLVSLAYQAGLMQRI